MTHATELILNAILTACGSAIFAGLCVWVRGLYKKSKTYDKAIKALTHNAFYQCCRELDPKPDISEDELENLNLLYDSYHSLGLNGTGEKLYNQVVAKPIRVNI